MGSFNETCALSNLNIGCGDPVKLLFLTRNPYVSSDQREANRGVYHYDQWFARTPPISGVYDDYGQAAFEDGSIPQLIAQCFGDDVVERPFGFNQFHAPAVQKGRDINHYLEAAWEGRLLVCDSYQNQRSIPEQWPTWEKVHDLLRKAGLQIMSGPNSGGYNAQPLVPGMVCVTYNSYESVVKLLEKARNVLDKHYDSRWLKKSEQDSETFLVVVPKGAIEDTTILHDREKYKELLSDRPDVFQRKEQQLPVMAVMIREDVWNVYCDLKVENFWKTANTVDHFESELKELWANTRNKKEDDPLIFNLFFKSSIRQILPDIPFMTMMQSHFRKAVLDKQFTDEQQLIRGIAELARVEFVMESLHQPWYIPPLGGQDGEWKVRTRLLKGLLKIAQKEKKADHEFD